MACVRCEIARAKVRAILLYGVGYSIEEIITELNDVYSGIYVAEWQGHNVEIRRVPNESVSESVLIASFKTERSLNVAVSIG